MPSIPIIMPQLGESIAEATVVNLLVPVGDHGADGPGHHRGRDQQGDDECGLALPGPGGAVPGQSLARATPSARCSATWKPARKTPRVWGWMRRRRTETAKKPPRNRRRRQNLKPTGRRAARPADRARPARPGECRRRQLHVPAHEGAHDGTGPARGGPGGPSRQRRRRARHHPGFREVHRQPREAQAEPGLHHARGRRRCHAAQLDPAAGDGRAARLLRPAAEPPQDVQSQARPGAVCACARWRWRWPRTAPRPGG